MQKDRNVINVRKAYERKDCAKRNGDEGKEEK